MKSSPKYLFSGYTYPSGYYLIFLILAQWLPTLVVYIDMKLHYVILGSLNFRKRGAS